MTEWTLLWGAVAVLASVLIARWYGRSWRALAEALAEALAHHQRRGSPPAPEADDAEAGARRGERVGAG